MLAGACAVTTDQRPGEIRHYSSVRDTPLLLGLVLAVLAVGTLSHVLLTSVRRAAGTSPCSRPSAWPARRSSR